MLRKLAQVETSSGAVSSRRGTRRSDSSTRLHQITFCDHCNEAIPARALACFHCGARQSRAEPALQIVFCEKCDEDYPAKAMACFHCGHLNKRHPLLNGQGAA